MILCWFIIDGLFCEDLKFSILFTFAYWCKVNAFLSDMFWETVPGTFLFVSRVTRLSAWPWVLCYIERDSREMLHLCEW